MQAVQQRAADAYIDVEAMRSTAMLAALPHLRDPDEPPSYASVQGYVNNALNPAMEATYDALALVFDAMVALFKAGYEFHYPQLPLFAAGVAVSWSWSDAAEQRNRESIRPIRDLILQPLWAGIERGELAERHDLRLVAGTLWDVFLRSYRRAVYDKRSSEDLLSTLRDQIALILAGLRV